MTEKPIQSLTFQPTQMIELGRSKNSTSNCVDDLFTKERLSIAEVYAIFQDGNLLEIPSRWLRSISRSQRKSPYTVSTYANCLKAFLTWLEQKNHLAPHAIEVSVLAVNTFDIENWIWEQRSAGLSPNTIRLREIAIREMYCWLTTDEGGKILEESKSPYRPTYNDIKGKLLSPKSPHVRPRKFTNKQLIDLIAGYHNESERVLAHFLYDTGLRISEAQRLLKSELPCEDHFEEGQKYYPLYVRGSKSYGSGGQPNERMTIISAPTLARIRRYHNSLSYRFSTYFSHDDTQKPCFLQVNGARLNPDNVRKQLKAAAIRAGLDPRYFSPHKFRHGCAFGVLQSELGNDFFDRLILAQNFLGHAQISTTEIYSQFSPAILRALHKNQSILEKYEEQKQIFNQTYLGRLHETENRGHRNS